MKTELKKLGTLLKEKRPELYDKLNSPLSDVVMSELERKYNVALPDDVKELYRGENGQSREGFKAFVSGFLFEPLEDVLSSAKEFTAMIGDEFFWRINGIRTGFLSSKMVGEVVFVMTKRVPLLAKKDNC